MYEELSSASTPNSSGLIAVFVVASLGLVGIGLTFAHGVFTGMSQTVLGLLLSAGFALLAIGTLVYFRLGHPHRITVEVDEELW